MRPVKAQGGRPPKRYVLYATLLLLIVLVAEFLPLPFRMWNGYVIARRMECRDSREIQTNHPYEYSD